MPAPAVSNVSSPAALGAGWRIAMHHRILVLISALAMTWERSVTLYTQWRGIDLEQFAEQYRKLLEQMAHDPLATGGLKPFSELYGLLAIVGFLFFIGAWLLVGVLGLIRDLLLRDGYEVRNVMRRGREFLWRIVRYKAPLYAANGFVALLLLPPLWRQWEIEGRFHVTMVLGALLFLMIFIGLRIWLSLGPKVIVTLEPARVLPVFGQVWQLIRNHLGPVIIFHMVILGAAAASAAVVAGLHATGLPWSAAALAGLLIAGFVAVMAKAGSFALYLQLAAHAARFPGAPNNSSTIPRHG